MIFSVYGTILGIDCPVWGRRTMIGKIKPLKIYNGLSVKKM